MYNNIEEWELELLVSFEFMQNYHIYSSMD